MMTKLSILLALILPLTLNSCLINHKREEYRPLPVKAQTSPRIFDDEIDIQIISKQYSNGGGLTSDTRAPFTVVTRIWTEFPYDGYKITSLILRVEDYHTDLASNTAPKYVRAEKNSHGLYMAEQNFPEAFSRVPENGQSLLTVTMSGVVTIEGRPQPFKTVKKFQFEKTRILQWMTWDDMMSI